jgi:hypothetical protein
MKGAGFRPWHRFGRCVGWTFLILAGLLLIAWLVFDTFFFRPAIFRMMLEAITDVRLQGISLEEARRRAPFPICLPEWLPEGLEGPELSFHAEWGAPWVADVTFNYLHQDRPILEIKQANLPLEWEDRDRKYYYDGYIKFVLLKWQLGAEAAEHLLPKAESIFLGDIEHNGRRYQVYELVNPSIYHAYWISWWKDDPKFSYSPPGEPDGYGIYYRILSRLSLIDTLKVAQNLENCLYPLPTPTLTLRKP